MAEPVMTRSRLGAVLVAVSALLHLAVLPQLALPWAAFMVGLVAVCVPCAIALWRHESVAAWTMVATTSAIMLVAHLVWGASMHPNSSTTHSSHADHAAHADHVASAGSIGEMLMLALLIVAAAELLLACFALVVRRREFVSAAPV